MKSFHNKFLTFVVDIWAFGGTAHADTALELIKDIEVHGFASTSYNYNFKNPVTPNNGNRNRIFDTDSNSFKFDIGELVLEKGTDKVGDVGFRTDISYGFSVPEVTKSTTGPNVGGTDVANDDFDLQQGYVSYKAPIGTGLQLDAGKFITHIGAEVIEGHDGWNYNHSRSFLFGLAIPFAHTGLRAGYTLNDKVSVMGMVANGWDNTTDNNNDKTLGAQIAYTPVDNVSLLLNWAGGDANVGVNNNSYLNIWDVVMNIGLPHDTLLQVNFDYGTQSGTSNMVVGDDAKWWGVAGIIRHDYNKWFSMNFRGEFFNDEDGVRATSITGTGVQLWEFTVTPEFRINQNLIFRVEYRHDEANRFAFNDGNNNILETTQDTIAANAMFYF